MKKQSHKNKNVLLLEGQRDTILNLNGIGLNSLIENAAGWNQLHTDEMKRPAGVAGYGRSSWCGGGVGVIGGWGGEWEVELGRRLKKPFLPFLEGKKALWRRRQR